jgi:hypothetical protein
MHLLWPTLQCFWVSKWINSSWTKQGDYTCHQCTILIPLYQYRCSSFLFHKWISSRIPIWTTFICQLKVLEVTFVGRS